jgi:hypothetical protein
MTAALGLETDLVDRGVYERTVDRFRAAGIALPTFAQLTDPLAIPAGRADGVDRDAPDPRNLWRLHWHNTLDGGIATVPDHVVLPPALTGVAAPIVVLLGDRFPLIGAHKVLAAYACLAPRLVTGQFDPTTQRAATTPAAGWRSPG